jgi:hypothetical protein
MEGLPTFSRWLLRMGPKKCIKTLVPLHYRDLVSISDFFINIRVHIKFIFIVTKIVFSRHFSFSCTYKKNQKDKNQ